MGDINKIMQDIYEEDMRKHLKLMNVIDTQMYERPYTEAELERIHDVANMERQYWADQYDLMLEKAWDNDWARVLLLHHRTRAGECYGCDVGGWEGEAPEWPCRTVKVATRGADDWSTQFDRPVRPLRKQGSGYVTIPVHTKRGNA